MEQLKTGDMKSSWAMAGAGVGAGRQMELGAIPQAGAGTGGITPARLGSILGARCLAGTWARDGGNGRIGCWGWRRQHNVFPEIEPNPHRFGVFGHWGYGVPLIPHPSPVAVPGVGGLSPWPQAAVPVPRSPVPIHLPVSSLQLFG